MSGLKHAPGPWSVVDNREMNGTFWIEAQHPDGFPVSIAEIRNGCGEADEIGDVVANYTLIAAAPSLLAACKGLAALDRTPDRFASPELLAARAAIREAEGQS